MRGRCSASVIRLAIAALACAFVESLGAEAAAGETHVREGEVVELTIAGTPDTQLEASLAELLERTGVSPRFAHATRPSRPEVTASPGLLAVVVLDLTRAGSIGLVILDARHATVLTRVIPAADGLDEIAREEISHIVLFSVEAIRRGEIVGSSEPQVIAPRVKAHPPPKERAKGELETVATLRTYANVAPVVVGVGAAVGASTRAGAFHLRSLVAFEQRSAIVAATRAASARFDQRSVRVSVAAGLPLSTRVELTFAGGVAADLVAVTTTALRATTEQQRDVVDVVPVLDAGGGISFVLAPGLGLTGALGAEVPLSTTEYALEAERNVVFLAPDAVRLVGRLSLGVSF
ncbi:MAG: hypothetical protein K0S65_2812 [Labilithrix sp.]|nr:hypothetical protein [Labilithrix sp.]